VLVALQADIITFVPPGPASKHCLEYWL